jgi:hypothetical protein
MICLKSNKNDSSHNNNNNNKQTRSKLKQICKNLFAMSKSRKSRKCSQKKARKSSEISLTNNDSLNKASLVSKHKRSKKSLRCKKMNNKSQKKKSKKNKKSFVNRDTIASFSKYDDKAKLKHLFKNYEQEKQRLLHHLTNNINDENNAVETFNDEALRNNNNNVNCKKLLNEYDYCEFNG